MVRISRENLAEPVGAVCPAGIGDDRKFLSHSLSVMRSSLSIGGDEFVFVIIATTMSGNIDFLALSDQL
ncbi:MAG: hypothetical protein ACUVQG_01710 [Thermogutta sp.]